MFDLCYYKDGGCMEVKSRCERKKDKKSFIFRRLLGYFVFFLSGVELIAFPVYADFLTKELFDGNFEFSVFFWVALFLGLFILGKNLIMKYSQEKNTFLDPEPHELLSEIDTYTNQLVKVNMYIEKNEFPKMNEIILETENCTNRNLRLRKNLLNEAFPEPYEINTDIDDYIKLMSRVRKYTKKNKYGEMTLTLNDKENDEIFTMFRNLTNSIEIIGVYYSDMYYAEEVGSYSRYKPVKSIRLPSDKYLNSKCSIYIDAFCGKKEDKYMKRDTSLNPYPINKILIVMVNANNKLIDLNADALLRGMHESHVLFVLIYENKPDVLFVGPDVRMYSDESYMGAIQVLNEMLQLNIDVSKL